MDTVSYLNFPGMYDKVRYISFTDHVGQGQLSQSSRQCLTKSVISVFQLNLDKVIYLTFPGNVGQGQ